MVAYRVERRLAAGLGATLAVPLVALGLTLLSGLVLFTALGSSPAAVARAWFVQPFQNAFGWGEVLLKMAPLLLIAQGLAIGFRAGVWNIGAEGQLIVGACAAAWLAIAFDGSTTAWLLPGMMLAGAFAGAAWAGIAALLRTRFNASEILTTFMLSQVALQLLYYLVTGPLRDPMGFNFPQSILFGPNAMFAPLMPGVRANASLYLGLAATVIAWIVMQRTVWGFRLQVGGEAPMAARYAGFDERRAIWFGLLAGGLCAGLAGVGEVAGPLGMLQRNVSPGYGFAAIIVAFLGGLHPLGILLAAFAMAVIYVGGDFALVSAGVPNASATVMQGLLLVFYLAASLILTHRVVRVRAVPRPASPTAPAALPEPAE